MKFVPIAPVSAVMVLTAGLALTVTKSAFAASTPEKAPTKTAEAAGETLTFTNKLENGKKIWTPLEANVNAEHALTITLVNTLGEPHGFTVPGLLEPVVVGAKETKTVHIASPKAGTYKFSCQLHPAHVGGQIVVK